MVVQGAACSRSSMFAWIELAPSCRTGEGVFPSLGVPVTFKAYIAGPLQDVCRTIAVLRYTWTSRDLKY